jgi:hypothetical protein
VPLVDVVYDDTIDDALLRRLGEALPDIVADAVDCPEEPWIGPPRRAISNSVAAYPPNAGPGCPGYADHH